MSDFDAARVASVLLKLTRGHVAFEQNEPQLHGLDIFWFRPVAQLPAAERDAFEHHDDEADLFPEVGSQAMNRLLIVGGKAFDEGWLIVQGDRDRYQTDATRVRMVLREYLACEVMELNLAGRVGPSLSG